MTDSVDMLYGKRIDKLNSITKEYIQHLNSNITSSEEKFKNYIDKWKFIHKMMYINFIIIPFLLMYIIYLLYANN